MLPQLTSFSLELQHLQESWPEASIGADRVRRKTCKDDPPSFPFLVVPWFPELEVEFTLLKAPTTGLPRPTPPVTFLFVMVLAAVFLGVLSPETSLEAEEI